MAYLSFIFYNNPNSGSISSSGTAYCNEGFGGLYWLESNYIIWVFREIVFREEEQDAKV